MAGLFFLFFFFCFFVFFAFLFQSGICFRCRLDNPRRFPNFQLPTIGVTAVAFQVYVWTHANEAKPPSRSPLEYGWRNENKYLGWLSKHLHHSGLWNFNRKSIAKAFAVGLFCAFIPVPFQHCQATE
jgi:hypothetical protein